jgi:hypothetical protein
VVSDGTQKGKKEKKRTPAKNRKNENKQNEKPALLNPIFQRGERFAFHCSQQWKIHLINRQAWKTKKENARTKNE